MKYLITYEDALELCRVYDNFNFSKTEFMIGDYKVVTFKYFLCDFNHFKNPLKDKPEVNAYDMRGVTFVFEKDGTLNRRFLMLPKFFNLDQVESTQYDVVKNKKIRSVTTKEDGSLIAFMGLPDDSVFCKTIGSFDNEQTTAAMKIYNEDSDVNLTVKALLWAGFTPMFEYVSFDNRIVLKYSKPELRLIGYRNNKTGEYVPGYRENACKCKVAEEFKDVTLDELIELSKTEEDREGWVVEFEDGQMIKIKTQWYFNLHGIRTMNIFREDYVIKNYLESKLDDIVCQLDEKEDADAFKFVDRVKLAVDNKMKHIDAYVNKLVEVYENEYDSTWHYYAKFNHKEAYFGLSKTKIEFPDQYNQRKIDFIVNRTKHLNKAKSFVDKWSGYDIEIKNEWSR